MYQKHLVRLLLLALVVIFSFLLVRAFLVAESFGRYGYYRGDSREEQMQLPLVYLGSSFCKDCHEPEYGDWQLDSHAKVTCEVCHGHWEIHNGRVKTMAADEGDGACLVCHQRVAGRPSGFPQVVSLVQHLEEEGRSREGVEGCLSCHDPHSPSTVKELQ